MTTDLQQLFLVMTLRFEQFFIFGTELLPGRF